MKNLITVILLSLLGNIVQAQTLQESSLENKERQVGINFTNFALRFLTLNEGEIEEDPSIFFYYKKGKGNKRKRFGLGGRVFWQKENNRLFTNLIQLNISFGKEYHRAVAKKWKVYHGWDGVMGLSNQEFKVKRNGKTTDKEFIRSAQLGYQVIGGLQFKWKKLSVFTETSYGLFFKFVGDNSGDEQYVIETIYKSPLEVILNYHF